jgi:hypothetical protein
MATIKLKDGKVILKDGKVSCECCDPCAGLWGPGYDTHPLIIFVSCPDPGNNYTGSRVLKCDWVRGDLFQYVQYLSASKRWKCTGTITGFTVAAYKNGTFSDGPLGVYSIAGGGGSLFTVS